MGLLHYLFSFSGRINRAKQWAFIFVGIAFEIAVVAMFSLIIGFNAVALAFQHETPFATFISTPQAHIFLLLLGLLYLVTVYASIAVMTKRLHDRDKSAWWLLVFLVLPLVLNIPQLLLSLEMFHHIGEIMKAAQTGHPYQPPQNPVATIGNGAATIVSLWAFVELFCLRGTVGDNRFGPDPLAGRS